MVGDDPERAGGFLVGSVSLACDLLDLPDDAGEEGGVVDGLHVVEHAENPLQPHAGVDVHLLEGRELALGVLEVLHEDVVPDLGVLPAVAGGSAVGSTLGPAVVEEDLGIGSAGSGLSGGAPPVVRLPVEEDLVVGHAVAPPQVGGLVVPGGVRVAGEDGDGELLPLDPEDLGEELVAPRDGLLLEVVAQGPVAQHLEERQVAGVPDLVDVPGPDAFLEVGQPPSGGVLLAEEVGDQRVHPRGGEQNGGVVLGYEGCGADLRVAPLLEEVDVGLSHLLSVHDAHSCNCPELSNASIYM